MIDLLLTGGTVVTVDPDRRVLPTRRVSPLTAAASWPSAQPTNRSPVSGTNGRSTALARRSCPGLIDAHGHGGHSLIKTLGSDTPTFWMRIVTPTYFHFTTPEYWYADGLLSALERLRFGVTCGVSVMGSMPRSDDPRIGGNHAKAYTEVGRARSRLRRSVRAAVAAPGELLGHRHSPGAPGHLRRGAGWRRGGDRDLAPRR